MGRTTTPTYRVVFDNRTLSAQAWDCRHYGRPTDERLEKFIDELEASTKPGGVNEHLTSLNVGSARVIRQATNEVVAEYTAPMFKIF